MNSEVLTVHRWNNWLHALLLLAGMGALLAAIGGVLGGPIGDLMALAFGGVVAAVTPRVSARWVLGMYRARRLQPSDAPGLFQAVNGLSQRGGVERSIALYYVPSQIMNAFSVGQREEPSIAITDGLIRGLGQRELLGVLAHEVSHIRHNDMGIMALADSVSRLVSLFSLFGQVLLAINVPLFLLGREGMPWIPILLLLAAPTVSALLQLALSRNREYDADVDAARLTGDPEGLALALEKLDASHGQMWESLLLPGPRIPNPSLLRTHPRTAERARRLRALTAGPGWETGPVGTMDTWSDWPRVSRGPRRRWSGLWY